MWLKSQERVDLEHPVDDQKVSESDMKVRLTTTVVKLMSMKNVYQTATSIYSKTQLQF